MNGTETVPSEEKANRYAKFMNKARSCIGLGGKTGVVSRLGSSTKKLEC